MMSSLLGYRKQSLKDFSQNVFTLKPGKIHEQRL